MSNDNDNIDLNEQLTGGQAGAGEGGEAIGGDDGLVLATERKTVSRSTLLMFGVLVLGAAGLFIMYRQAGPRSADAAIRKENADAKKTINTFLSGGQSSVQSMQEVLKSTQKIMQQFMSHSDLPQVPLGDLKTNPFRQHAKADEAALSEAAQKKKQEEERLAVKKAAAGLQAQLQSIMCSDMRKACMVNGKIYLEGQIIGDFTVEKVTPSFVIVRNGPYRFQLTMKR